MSKDIPTEDEFVMEGLSDEEKSQLQDVGEGQSSQTPSGQPQGEGAGAVEPVPQEPVEPSQAIAPDQSKDDKPKGPDERAAAERRTREMRELRAENARLRERTDAILKALEAQGKPDSNKEDEPKPDRRQLVAQMKEAVQAGDFTKRDDIDLQLRELDIAEREEQARQAEEYQAQSARQQEDQALINVGAQQLREAFKQDPNFDSAYRTYAGGLRYQAAVDLGFVRPGEPYQPYDQGEWEKVQAKADEYARQDTMMGQRGAFSFPDIVMRRAHQDGWRPDQQPNGGQQQPAQPTSAAGMDRHMSLSSAGGGAAPAPIDAKAIANMPQSEFDKLMQTPEGAKQIDIAMGLQRP